MAVAFDTLDFMERLKAGGVAEREARAITDAFSHATAQQLATKADLDTLRLELKVDLQALENRLLVKLGGMTAADVAVIGVIVTLTVLPLHLSSINNMDLDILASKLQH